MSVRLFLLAITASQVASFIFSSFSLRRPLQRSTFHSLHPSEPDVEKHAPKLECLMKNTFDNLKNYNNKLRYKDFLKFEGIQRMIAENLMQPSDLEQIWKRSVDSELKPANFDEFLKVNDGINELFGECMDAMDLPQEFESAWNENRAIAPRFVGNTVEYLREYFDSVAFKAAVATPRELSISSSFGDNNEDDTPDSATGAETKLITFKSFADWDEISILIQSGELEPHFVKDLWQEALEHRYRHAPSPEHIRDSQHSVLSDEMLAKISGKDMYQCTDPAYCIDFDTFLRLNYRLDEVVEDSIDAPERAVEQQYEALYKQEFNKITHHAKLMTFDQLVQWDKMQEMLANEAVTMHHLQDLWAVMPKDYIPEDGKVHKFAPSDKSGTEAINFMAFTAINNEIQASLRSDSDT